MEPLPRYINICQHCKNEKKSQCQTLTKMKNYNCYNLDVAFIFVSTLRQRYAPFDRRSIARNMAGCNFVQTVDIALCEVIIIFWSSHLQIVRNRNDTKQRDHQHFPLKNLCFARKFVGNLFWKIFHFDAKTKSFIYSLAARVTVQC